MRTKAAQDPNQHRKSTLRLCFDRMFDATHGGRWSRNDFLGWDVDAGKGVTWVESGDLGASEDGDFGLDAMTKGGSAWFLWCSPH
jgi:hypothetical protein